MGFGASQTLSNLIRSPSMRLLSPGERSLELLFEACQDGAMTRNLVFDAQTVAPLRENGIKAILTEDRNFMRLSDFRIETL